MAVCDTVGFKVPADYRFERVLLTSQLDRSELNLNNNITKNTRKQVTEVLKDFLADIKNENKLKSLKKSRRGSILSKFQVNSSPITPTNNLSKVNTYLINY